MRTARTNAALILGLSVSLACANAGSSTTASTLGGSTGASGSSGVTSGATTAGTVASTASATGSSGSSSTGGPSSGATSSSGAGSTGGSTSGTVQCPSGTVSFFVAPSGNDSWSGTLAAPNDANTDGPFGTIQRAQAAVATAIDGGAQGTLIVQIRAGTYPLAAPLTFGSADTGNADAGTVYEAYPNETPVLSGGIVLTGWTPVDAGGPTAWQATVPTGVTPFEQLWIGGTRRYRPTSTGTSYLYNGGNVCLDAADPAGHCVYSDAGNRCPLTAPFVCYDRFQFMPGDDLNPQWYGLDAGSIEVDDFEQWTMSRMRLGAIDGGVAYFTGVTTVGPDTGILPGHRYLVENVREALSVAGQWYWDGPAGTVTYLSEPEENPNTQPVVIPQTAQLLVANNLANVTFCGLTFAYTNWVTPAAGYTTFEPGTWDTPAALSFSSSSDIAVTECTLAHLGGNGIELTSATANDAGPGCVNPAPLPSSGDLITGNVITDLGISGIRLGPDQNPQCNTAADITQHSTVSNNLISGYGRLLPEGVGVLTGDTHDVVVSNNEIYDSYGLGINLGHDTAPTTAPAHQVIKNNTVSFNLLHDLKQGVTSDGAAIHLVIGEQVAGNGNTVLDNLVHDIVYDPGRVDGGCSTQCVPGGPPCSACYQGYGANGIYLDDSSEYATVEYNLVYRVDGAGLSVNPAALGHLAQYNIFAFSRQASVARLSNSLLDVTFENNILYWDQDTFRAAVPGAPFYGDWDCQDAVIASSCLSQFVFASNLYWFTRGSPAGLPNFFIGATPGAKTIYDGGLASWTAATGEDTGSLVADPGFPDASYGVDDFGVSCASTPEAQIGFDCPNFQATQAGRLPGALPRPPSVPPAFPLQLPANPATFF